MDLLETSLVTIRLSHGQHRRLTDLFHRVNNIIPQEQRLVTVNADTSVGEALDLLRRFGFSQIPVVEGNEVLGVFSYRSFSFGIIEMKDVKIDVQSLPVEEFLEHMEFVQVYDELPTCFKLLDRDNAVLVGNQSKIQGIITPMDVLRYLYGIASPFVMLTEIELTIRMLISVSVDMEELRVCAENSLKQLYKDKDIPSHVEEMTFNDYVQVIGDGRNWSKFDKAFASPGEYARKSTRTKLEEIRDLRNDVFHFKRELTNDDRATLWNHRNWLLRRARMIEARQKAN
ncbi:MAG: CBS domain-containing protein [Chloroflexota bacterium]|nr:CBS domain-containing protein [Chloroflexota bacterium]